MPFMYNFNMDMESYKSQRPHVIIHAHTIATVTLGTIYSIYNIHGRVRRPHLTIHSQTAPPMRDGRPSAFSRLAAAAAAAVASELLPLRASVSLICLVFLRVQLDFL